MSQKKIVGAVLTRVKPGEYDVVVRGQLAGHLTTDAKGWYHLNGTAKRLYPLQQAVDHCIATLPKPTIEWLVHCFGCNSFPKVRAGTICIVCETIVKRVATTRCPICKESVLLDEQTLHYDEVHNPDGFVDEPEPINDESEDEDADYSQNDV